MAGEFTEGIQGLALPESRLEGLVDTRHGTPDCCPSKPLVVMAMAPVDAKAARPVAQIELSSMGPRARCSLELESVFPRCDLDMVEISGIAYTSAAGTKSGSRAAAGTRNRNACKAAQFAVLPSQGVICGVIIWIS